MKKQQITKISICALFTAIIAASAWICIPTPFGVNLTMQIFAVALSGFYLGAKAAFAATAAYIAVGAVGLPVFSLFTGGVSVLTGTSGGFLWGFLAVSLICGCAVKLNKKSARLFMCAVAVLVCHAIGIIQYCAISGINVFSAFLAASLPFLLKDFIAVFLAELTAKKLNKRLKG